MSDWVLRIWTLISRLMMQSFYHPKLLPRRMRHCCLHFILVDMWNVMQMILMVIVMVLRVTYLLSKMGVTNFPLRLNNFLPFLRTCHRVLRVWTFGAVAYRSWGWEKLSSKGLDSEQSSIQRKEFQGYTDSALVLNPLKEIKHAGKSEPVISKDLTYSAGFE